MIPFLIAVAVAEVGLSGPIDDLKRLLTDPWHPLQIIFAGKAHLADVEGKRLIQKVFRLAQDPEFGGRIAFVEDYDQQLADYMVHGVDVWLNNPIPPLEASGTSGMKASVNGVPNLSILNGWWIEGFDGSTVGLLADKSRATAPRPTPRTSTASWRRRSSPFSINALTMVGTMSGQIIMQGFLRRQIPAWIRRLVTMLPSLIVIGIGLDPTRTLVLSQVVLSFGLPFAIFPLVLFTGRRELMGVLVNRRLTTVLVSIIAALIVALNAYLLVQTFSGG